MAHEPNSFCGLFLNGPRAKDSFYILIKQQRIQTTHGLQRLKFYYWFLYIKCLCTPIPDEQRRLSQGTFDLGL